MPNNADIVRQYFEAYRTSDRELIESVVADDFHFTSPLDNAIDRETYFERCWPNSDAIADLHLIRLVEDGARVVATYEGETDTGRRFRNTEIFTVRDRQIVDVEVYFGWTLPHEAPDGGFLGAPDRD